MVSSTKSWYHCNFIQSTAT